MVPRAGDATTRSGVEATNSSDGGTRSRPGRYDGVRSSLEGSLPHESFHQGQELVPGYQHLTMRDGTRLSAFVSLPGPIEDGPYPTIVNYSGYSPSRPEQPSSEELDYLCESYPVLCEAPAHPSGILAGVTGYASVGVNLRGTGCSGGPYDYFEPLQLTDGYAIIEIVANQDWVLHNHVGMAGLSLPGHRPALRRRAAAPEPGRHRPPVRHRRQRHLGHGPRSHLQPWLRPGLGGERAGPGRALRPRLDHRAGRGR